MYEGFKKRQKGGRYEDPGTETFNFQIGWERNLVFKGRGQPRTPNRDLTPRNVEVVCNTDTFKRNLPPVCI